MRLSRLLIVALLTSMLVNCAPSQEATVQDHYRTAAQSSKPVLDWDSELVANYRAMDWTLPPDVDSRGLSQLNASGSAQFNEPQFEWIKSQTSKNVVVIDLREESHAILNRTKQIGWQVAFNAANRGLTLDQIVKDENAKIANVQSKKFIQMFSWENVGGNWQMLPKVDWEVSRITSEQGLVGPKNYRRIPVTDHEVPQPRYVDAFLKLVAERDSNTWFHFHCLAGMGRTTTFLAMLDMYFNAHKVSFEMILRRQTELGGIDLLEGGDYASVERRKHLRKFYDFSKERKAHPKLSWSAWISEN